MSSKKILLFDFDGTIVDSIDVALEAYNAIAYDYSLPKMQDKKAFVKLYDDNFYSSLMKLGLLREKIQDFTRELREWFLKCGYGAKLFSGMKEVVNKLAEKNQLIVITSNIGFTVKGLIKEAGLNIEEVLGGDKETSKMKKILSVKKRFPDAELYYIGDTKGDVLEGQRAGVKTIAVSWGYHAREELEKVEPDFIVNKPEELLNIFKE